MPILILNKDDESLQSASKKSRRKPNSKNLQSTVDNTHNESDLSGRADVSGQRSVLESSFLEGGQNSMFPIFVRCLETVLKSLDTKAKEMEPKRPIASETLKR